MASSMDVVLYPGFLLLILGLPLVTASWSQELSGNYCKNRKPSQCCDDRLDDCAVTIQGTLCYCDKFCLVKDDTTGLHDDCCPDYREVCLGQKPTTRIPVQADPPSPPGQISASECKRDGVKVPHLATHKFNCHQCTCNRTELTCDKELCLVDEDTIRRVNQGHYSWRATMYDKFWGWSAREGLPLRTGTLAPSFLMYPIRLHPVLPMIPKVFDARNKNDWHGLISGIRDQGWCSASWAFSTLAVIEDRLAIMSQGRMVPQLSPEQMLGCIRRKGDLCRAGGHVDQAWNYLRRTGVVAEECLPYESRAPGRRPQCKVPRGDTTNLSCQNPKLYKSEPAYRISGKVQDIQWEIITKGPVQAIMRVWPELAVYGSGVFTCPLQRGRWQPFLHSVRLLGWGEDSGWPGSPPIKYWVAANSWGRDWGEGGYFRIRRGTNECGIESFVLAVRPNQASFHYGN